MEDGPKTSHMGQEISPVTYDPNGNLARDGTRTLEWDAEDRLTRVAQGGAEIARFTYDGQGRRAQKVCLLEGYLLCMQRCKQQKACDLI